MILSHHCGRNCDPLFFMLMLEFIDVLGIHLCAAIFSLATLFKSGWDVDFTGFTTTPRFFFFFINFFQICCCAWDHCPGAWPNYSHALAVRQMASHLTLECFGIQRSSWSTPWLQGAQVLWLQNEPKSSHLNRYAWQRVWGVCADVLCLVFIKALGIMTKSLHFNVSKGHCSRTAVVCSDATLLT